MNRSIDNWSRFWDEKSQNSRDFAATGRGLMDEVGFLHTYLEICRLLDFSRKDRVLDIGCGTALLAMAIKPLVREIDCIDLSEKMVERAKCNTQGLAGVSIWRGAITDTGAASEYYERCLVYSVTQYLSDERELRAAFREISRVLKPGGKALIAANPDPEREQDYRARLRDISGGVLTSQDEELIKSTLWVSKDRMVGLASRAGLNARTQPISERIWQSFYMFDLLLEKPASTVSK